LRIFIFFPSTLKMEATHSSETSVNTTCTRRHIPEDCFLHSHCRENLKSYTVINLLTDWEARSVTTVTTDHVPLCHCWAWLRDGSTVGMPGIWPTGNMALDIGSDLTAKIAEAHLSKTLLNIYHVTLRYIGETILCTGSAQ
jgi:hypothetical protein